MTNLMLAAFNDVDYHFLHQFEYHDLRQLEDHDLRQLEDHAEVVVAQDKGEYIQNLFGLRSKYI